MQLSDGMMRRKFWLFGIVMLILAGCGGKVQESPLPTETALPPTHTPAPSATPRQMVPSPTAFSTREPTSTPGPIQTQTPESLPDLSGVSLHEVTHLMDPRLFQVSMNGWPEDLPEDVIVRVGLEIYSCEVLFPDLFPNRVYCWGKAPPRGTEVKIQVILEDVPLPLLEIPFRVPYPSSDG